MKLAPRLTLLPALLLSAIGSTGATAAELDTVLFHNATLINPATQERTPDGWLLIRDGNIIQQGQHTQSAPLPTAAKQIDLRDSYVMPGLIDVHLHLTSGPLQVTLDDGHPVISLQGREDITRYHAISTLASGVTSAFSPAGDPQANAAYAKAQQRGDWPGPKLYYAGFTFDPTPIEGGSVYPANDSDWQAEIARQKALGVSHIKLYSGLSQDEVGKGIRFAKAAGMKTVAHLDQVSWQFAAQQGIDKLTHALPTSAELLTGKAKDAYLQSRANPVNQRFIYQWFEYADYDSEVMQQLFSTLATQQVQVDLTLLVNEMFYFAHELERLYPQEQMWVFHPETRQGWRANMAAPGHDWSEEDYAAAQRQLPKVQQLFKRLYQAGVPMAIGTDMLTSGPFYLRELQLSKAAGLDNWEVLTLATSGGAKHLGRDDLGQLKPGFAADFIVLKQDPSEDLAALQHIDTVVQRGIAHNVEQLRAQLPTLISQSN